MRNIFSILGMVLATVALFTACDGSKMNNNGEGKKIESGLSGNDLIQPDYYYELDTWGTNADIFEFTLQSNPNMVVVNVGQGKERGIFVIPKLSKEENQKHLKSFNTSNISKTKSSSNLIYSRISFCWVSSNPKM